MFFYQMPLLSISKIVKGSIFKLNITFFALLIFSNLLNAQKLTGEELKVLANEKFPDAIQILNNFLSLPNDGHFPSQVSTNLEWCERTFSNLNFKTKVITTDGAPLLFAEKSFQNNVKTVLFYLQIDGQPVDSTKWDQPDPFKPVLKEFQNGKWEIIRFENLKSEPNPDWRIFARSASDSKGPAMSLITALEILQQKKIKPQFNIKVIMDFQEEMGSPHLPKAVTNNKDLMSADMLFIMDGTRHISNLPTLTYGARGIATATLKTFGPRYPLHSGQYGNFAPNPIFPLAKLLASLKDDNGKVMIPGFYGGVALTEKDKVALKNVPDQKDSLLATLGTAESESIGDTYEESMQYPSLNIRGLNAAWVGDEVRTIIPSEVVVEIDMRLVPESDGRRLMELLKKFIQDTGYHLVDGYPNDEERKKYPKLASFTYSLGSLPFRTEMDSEIGLFLNKALEKVFGDEIVNMRTTGGSQPMSPFITTLNIPAVSIRIPNPDNNIHSPNENLRLGNYLEGIVTCLAILDEPIK